MSQRIEELKDLHIKSKPEMQQFLKNLTSAAKSRNLAKLLWISDGFPDVVKGYDWVIDELFEHIERLDKDNAELHDHNALLHAELEGAPQQQAFTEERIRDLEAERDELLGKLDDIRTELNLWKSSDSAISCIKAIVGEGENP